VFDGVVETVLQAGELAEHGLATDVQPAIIDDAKPLLNLIGDADTPWRISGRDRGACREQAVGTQVPWMVESGTARGSCR
jgi:hypothetical protein